jgi:hypothetical protein
VILGERGHDARCVRHVAGRPSSVVAERTIGSDSDFICGVKAAGNMPAVAGRMPALPRLTWISHSTQEQTDAAGHVLNGVNKRAIDFHFDRRRGR